MRQMLWPLPCVMPIMRGQGADNPYKGRREKNAGALAKHLKKELERSKVHLIGHEIRI